MKYPIGIQDFQSIREGGYVYVDKTSMIYALTHEGKIFFLGRPRRFGKSLLMSTLKYYFLGRKELFRGLDIEKIETEWKSYPVFHIDFGLGTNYLEKETLNRLLDSYISRWEHDYDIQNIYVKEDYSLRFKTVLEAAHNKTGNRAVVLIDEYDKPLLDVMSTNITVKRSGEQISLEQYNRELLRGFYTTFKAADEHLQFVMLMGITKFSQVSVFSGFNQPNDISMLPQYDSICGITQKELFEYFHEPIQELALFYNCNLDEMVQKLKKQYDGYHFSDRLHGVYNPFSLLNAFYGNRIQDYWFRTGTPTSLVRLLQHFDENINELTGKYYTSDQFTDYRADAEKPLPMIFQSGYLTIKDYDIDTNSFLLDFPNDEVKRGFVTLLANNYLKTNDNISSWMLTAITALKRGEIEQFRVLLTSFFSSIPYTMRRKDSEREKERYFHYTFYLLLRLMSTYLIYTEKAQSQGRVDCIVETPNYIYIFEFKLDGTASEALKQINDKNYAREYISDTRHIYKIGCSFSSESGTIEDWTVEN